MTPEYETVWEYVSPYYEKTENFNLVYRAYRVPYDYVPQLGELKEEAIVPPENATIRLSDLTTTR